MILDATKQLARKHATDLINHYGLGQSMMISLFEDNIETRKHLSRIHRNAKRLTEAWEGPF